MFIGVRESEIGGVISLSEITLPFSLDVDSSQNLDGELR